MFVGIFRHQLLSLILFGETLMQQVAVGGWCFADWSSEMLMASIVEQVIRCCFGHVDLWVRRRFQDLSQVINHFWSSDARFFLCLHTVRMHVGVCPLFWFSIVHLSYFKVAIMMCHRLAFETMPMRSLSSLGQPNTNASLFAGCELTFGLCAATEFFISHFPWCLSAGDSPPVLLFVVCSVHISEEVLQLQYSAARSRTTCSKRANPFLRIGTCRR